MADEQTPDFADDFTGFAAPPADDSHIGDAYYNNADNQSGEFFNPPANDEQTGDFFNPPVEAEAPIILGGDYDAPSGYDAPSDVAPDAMGFAAAPSGLGVENVDDDDDDAKPAADSLVPAEQSPMAKWNDEWQETLLQRKDDENALKGEHVEKAREEIAAFQAERERKRESRMAKNRSDEQDKLEAIEADLENDNSWQRVVKMIELNQDSSEGAVDTGRMKDVLVLLKNEPSRADMLSA